MNTAYINAPDLLLDKIAEANAVLDKQKKDSSSYKFWRDVVDIMLYSYNYMTDTRQIHSRNTFLESENYHLKILARETTEKLEKYEVVKALILSGQLDATIETVNKTINER